MPRQKMPIPKVDFENYDSDYLRNRAYIAEQARIRRKEIKAEFEKYLEEEGKKYHESENSN